MVFDSKNYQQYEEEKLEKCTFSHLDPSKMIFLRILNVLFRLVSEKFGLKTRLISLKTY